MADPGEVEELVHKLTEMDQMAADVAASIESNRLALIQTQQMMDEFRTSYRIYYAFRDMKKACEKADLDAFTAALDSVSGHDWSTSEEHIYVCYIMPDDPEKLMHIKTICRLMLTFGLISNEPSSLGAICRSYGDIYETRFPFNLLKMAVDYGLSNSVDDDEFRLFIFNANLMHETVRGHRLKIILEAGVSPYISTLVVGSMNSLWKSEPNMWKMMVEADF